VAAYPSQDGPDARAGTTPCESPSSPRHPRGSAWCAGSERNLHQREHTPPSGDVAGRLDLPRLHRLNRRSGTRNEAPYRLIDSGRLRVGNGKQLRSQRSVPQGPVADRCSPRDHTERYWTRRYPKGHQEVKSPRHQFSGGRPSELVPTVGERIARSFLELSSPRGQCVGVNAAAIGASGAGIPTSAEQTHPSQQGRVRTTSPVSPTSGWDESATPVTHCARRGLRCGSTACNGRNTRPKRWTNLSQARATSSGQK